MPTPDKGRYQPDQGASDHPPVVRDWLDQHGDNTLRAYTADINLWLSWCDGHGVHPLTATRADCDRYKRWLADVPSKRTGRVRANATQARALATVASLYWYMESEDLLEGRHPLVHVRRPEEDRSGATKALSEDEAVRYLAAARGIGPAELAAAATILGTAVRAGGLLSINVPGLTIHDGRMLAAVRLKGGETVDLPLPQQAADAVDVYRAERVIGPLFAGPAGGRLSYDALAEMCVRIGERASISKRTTPHVLRTTWATIALSKGVSPEYVRAVMGHKKIETTLGYDRRREDLARKIKAVDEVSAVLFGQMDAA